MLHVSKKISVSDDLYRRLKREKGDRGFNEVIAETLATGYRLSDVSGAGILDPETEADVADEIGRLSDGTIDRFDDEAH
jgi:predicted CopG family antitoxin